MKLSNLNWQWSVRSSSKYRNQLNELKLNIYASKCKYKLKQQKIT
jgi:hypothetical protein